MTAGRSYRTHIEILGDLLRASRAPASKTRIMVAANLNSGSLQKYLHFCIEHELICATSGGYVATRWGDSLLEALEKAVARTTGDFGSAVRPVQRDGRGRATSNGASGNSLRRDIYRWLWNDILVKSENGSPAHRSGGFSNEGSSDDGDQDLFSTDAPSPNGSLEEGTRSFVPRIPREDSPTMKANRRNTPSSRPGR